MSKLIIGIIIGVLMPLIMDLFLFGTPFPCSTVTTYEDGSSVQKCSVRN
jgi:hypothetical protein